MNFLTQQLVRLYKDEQGAEGLEKVLIIAAIVLPVLGFIIAVFNGPLKEFFAGWWETITGSTEDMTDTGI